MMDFVRWDHFYSFFPYGSSHLKKIHMVPVTTNQVPSLPTHPPGPFAPRPSRHGHDFPHGGAPHLFQLRDLTDHRPLKGGRENVLEGDDGHQDKYGFNMF